MRLSLLLTSLLGCGPLTSPPSKPVVSIEPADATSDDDLTCALVEPSIDPDGGEVTHRFDWAVNDQWLGLDQAVVPSNMTQAGESWACKAAGSDAYEEGEESEPATIVLGDPAGG